MIRQAIAGFHRYTPFLSNLRAYLPKFDDVYTYKFNIAENAYYDPFISDHTNKLCGINLGLKKHNNSVRIGWTPSAKYENQFDIKLYAYSNGERIIAPITTLRAFQYMIVEFSISDTPALAMFKKSKFDFCVNVAYKVLKGDKVVFNRAKTVLFSGKKSKFVFEHNPYFGGKDAAYFNHTIYLEKL